MQKVSLHFLSTTVLHILYEFKEHKSILDL